MASPQTPLTASQAKRIDRTDPDFSRFKIAQRIRDLELGSYNTASRIQTGTVVASAASDTDVNPSGGNVATPLYLMLAYDNLTSFPQMILQHGGTTGVPASGLMLVSDAAGEVTHGNEGFVASSNGLASAMGLPVYFDPTLAATSPATAMRANLAGIGVTGFGSAGHYAVVSTIDGRDLRIYADTSATPGAHAAAGYSALHIHDTAGWGDTPGLAVLTAAGGTAMADGQRTLYWDATTGVSRVF